MMKKGEKLVQRILGLCNPNIHSFIPSIGPLSSSGLLCPPPATYPGTWGF